MTTWRARVCGVATALVLVAPALGACARPGLAQMLEGGTGEPLRMVAIVDPTPAVADSTLGTLKVRAGTTVRTLGVVRAILPNQEGMSIFQKTDLQPENLRLVGAESLLQPFLTAPAGTTLSITGLLQVGRQWMIVNSIESQSSPTPTS